MGYRVEGVRGRGGEEGLSRSGWKQRERGTGSEGVGGEGGFSKHGWRRGRGGQGQRVQGGEGDRREGVTQEWLETGGDRDKGCKGCD